jgi:hypothetical protein
VKNLVEIWWTSGAEYEERGLKKSGVVRFGADLVPFTCWVRNGALKSRHK